MLSLNSDLTGGRGRIEGWEDPWLSFASTSAFHVGYKTLTTQFAWVESYLVSCLNLTVPMELAAGFSGEHEFRAC